MNADEMRMEDRGLTGFGFEARFQSRRLKHRSEMSNPKIGHLTGVEPFTPSETPA
jgi:hypothetical protein